MIFDFKHAFLFAIAPRPLRRRGSRIVSAQTNARLCTKLMLVVLAMLAAKPPVSKWALSTKLS